MRRRVVLQFQSLTWHNQGQIIDQVKHCIELGFFKCHHCIEHCLVDCGQCSKSQKSLLASRDSSLRARGLSTADELWLVVVVWRHGLRAANGRVSSSIGSCCYGSCWSCGHRTSVPESCPNVSTGYKQTFLLLSSSKLLSNNEKWNVWDLKT